MKQILIIIISVMIVGMGTHPVFSQDSDSDGVSDTKDNCPETPNGPMLGTCLTGENIGVL